MNGTATVATVLLPDERDRVAAAGQDCFVTLHAETLDEAIRKVRRQPVDAVFLSPTTVRMSGFHCLT